MTHLARIAAQIFNTPLLVTPDVAATIACALSDRFGLDARDLEASVEASFEASRFVGAPRGPRDADGNMRTMYRLDSGVALIPVMGELVNRGAWIGASSGLTSYEGLDATLDAALADPIVKGIVLDMNSPGGQASGAMETAAKVRAVSQTKPVVAFVNGYATSAAYALASGASKIVATPSATLGHIGVVWMHLDRTAQAEKAGVKPTILTAGAYKADGIGLAALDSGARARIQAQIDGVYDLFVNTVAAHRSMDAKAVRATEAGVFMGQQAVAAGLADSVGTLADALAFANPNSANSPFANSAHGAGVRGNVSTGARAARTTEGPKMTDETTITKAALDSAVAAATAEGLKAGATAERARIAAILGDDKAKGRETLAKHFAFATDMAADMALAALDASPTASAAAPDKTPLAAAMASRRDPNPGPGGDAPHAPAARGIDTAAVYARRAAAARH